jgi:hypothetical protein
MEALRAFGYSPEAALADLIDNSITALAREVSLRFHWDESDSWISVQDDGEGMDLPRLIEAMRPGTTNPREERSVDDLGRFGLGLKTASLSQARSLTVLSKPKGGQVEIRRWDLDHVGRARQWHLLHGGSSTAELLAEQVLGSDSGTVVLWEKLDRVLETTGSQGPSAEDRFLDIAETVEHHLAMVYHRFLRGPGRIRITINDREIEGWDPFLSEHPSTQRLMPEDHPAFGSVVGVTPFVLPHHSKLQPDEHQKAGGPSGWNAHQGFFVYRNRRLLVPGSWLGLGFRKEEHYKLARIQIDIPNSMDEQWSIDVKKSSARPPGLLRDDLKRIAKLTRKRAVEVYRHRGKTVARTPGQPAVNVWNRHVRDGHLTYRINRQHPLIRDILKAGSSTNRTLRILEETVPVHTIYIDASEHPDSHRGPFGSASDGEIEAMLYDLLSEYVGNGWDVESAAQFLLGLEPFQDFGDAIGRCVAVLESKERE